MHIEREAGEPELVGKLDRDVIGRLLGRKRAGVAERHQDRPAAVVRDYIIRELRHDKYSPPISGDP
jgi:hypothetical protein